MTKAALSEKGRQEFGSWLANRLMVAAGGVGGLILAPTLTGASGVMARNVLVGWLALALLVALGVIIKLDASERRGDSLPSREQADG